MILGLTMSLMQPQGVLGGGGPPPSAITNLTIMDATPLDATGDYSDATTRIGVNGSGWVAKVTVPYLAGQTFDPSKIALVVTDPGYTASGTTTVTRTIHGSRVMRRQYHAETNLQQSNDGTTETIYVGFDEWVYAGTTIITATAAPGFYGVSASGSITSLTNNSTKAYPKPLWSWMNFPTGNLATGSSLYVEGMAAHQHAMNGRQVARVEYIGRDSQATPNVAATQVCSTPTLSTIQTQGQVAEVYPANIPLTNLTQGDTGCRVNVKVYPWIGDSSAVLDLSVDGTDWPSWTPLTQLQFVCDKAGTWGGAYAYVKTGVTGGTPSQTAATARATPYPTVVAALNGLRTWCHASAVPIHPTGDMNGCTVRLMDNAGAAFEHDLTGAALYAMTGADSELARTVIEQDPLNTAKASITASRVAAEFIFVPPMLQWRVDIRATAAAAFRGSINPARQFFDRMTYATDTGNPFFQQTAYFRDTTMTGANAFIEGPQVVGSTWHATGATANRSPVLVGNDFEQIAFDEWTTASAPSPTEAGLRNDARFIYNTRFMKTKSSCRLGFNTAIVKGFAFLQCVIERITAASTPALSIGGDGGTFALNNIIRQHTTVIGNRSNIGYADVAAAAGVEKYISSKFDLEYETNRKTDLFLIQTTVTGRVGNWAYVNSVGCLGDVVLTGSSNGDTPADGAWVGEWWPAATYNVGVANVGFTNFQADDTGAGTTGVGGGTYSLTGSTNAAYDNVPAGLQTLAFDLAGVARKNDGHGASGAYERTV